MTTGLCLCPKEKSPGAATFGGTWIHCMVAFTDNYSRRGRDSLDTVIDILSRAETRRPTSCDWQELNEPKSRPENCISMQEGDPILRDKDPKACSCSQRLLRDSTVGSRSDRRSLFMHSIEIYRIGPDLLCQ